VPQPTEFELFFRQVVGEQAADGKAAAAAKRIRQRFGKELDNPKTSLVRLRQIWNQTASVWKKMVFRELMEQEIKAIKMHGRINPSDHIASIGSGPGIHEAFIAKHLVPKGRVTCIDFSLKMSRLARQTREKAQVSNMSVFARSGHRTGLPAASQDKVLLIQTTAVDSIHWQPIIKEVRRIIKEGFESRFIFSFTTEDVEKTKAPVLKSLRENGFRDEIVLKYAVSGKNKAIMVIAKPILKQ
jgi:ubiquinone/menaquinone biosynthesis C-methylase UbiE